METMSLRNEIEKVLEAQLSRKMIAHTPLGDTDILNASIIAKHIAPEILSLLEAHCECNKKKKLEPEDFDLGDDDTPFGMSDYWIDK